MISIKDHITLNFKKDKFSFFRFSILLKTHHLLVCLKLKSNIYLFQITNKISKEIFIKMNIRYLIGLLVIALSLDKALPNEEVNKVEANFDYLILRQIWPSTTCMFPGEHTCSIAKNISTWVVHGLW
jgi:hypothetical protein